MKSSLSPCTVFSLENIGISGLADSKKHKCLPPTYLQSCASLQTLRLSQVLDLLPVNASNLQIIVLSLFGSGLSATSRASWHAVFSLDLRSLIYLVSDFCDEVLLIPKDISTGSVGSLPNIKKLGDCPVLSCYCKLWGKVLLPV